MATTAIVHHAYPMASPSVMLIVEREEVDLYPLTTKSELPLTAGMDASSAIDHWRFSRASSPSPTRTSPSYNYPRLLVSPGPSYAPSLQRLGRIRRTPRGASYDDGAPSAIALTGTQAEIRVKKCSSASSSNYPNTSNPTLKKVRSTVSTQAHAAATTASASASASQFGSGSGVHGNTHRVLEAHHPATAQSWCPAVGMRRASTEGRGSARSRSPQQFADVVWRYYSEPEKASTSFTRTKRGNETMTQPEASGSGLGSRSVNMRPSALTGVRRCRTGDSQATRGTAGAGAGAGAGARGQWPAPGALSPPAAPGRAPEARPASALAVLRHYSDGAVVVTASAQAAGTVPKPSSRQVVKSLTERPVTMAATAEAASAVATAAALPVGRSRALRSPAAVPATASLPSVFPARRDWETGSWSSQAVRPALSPPSSVPLSPSGRSSLSSVRVSNAHASYAYGGNGRHAPGNSAVGAVRSRKAGGESYPSRRVYVDNL